ncbi:MAG: efflux RND transporter permease subunit, partial [Proteobacteria bacterium]|nr:efflux RND transporter permease subunit [Pseudomonadota bacterium]
PENAGEYTKTLFSVVAISLMISWVVSMTVTPLMCMDMLPAPKAADAGKDPFDTAFFRTFRNLLAASIRVRWLTIGIAVAFLALSVVGFGNVKQLFFPDSSMTKFMVDYWAPEGTRIEQVAADLQLAEVKLLADERVTGVASYIGAGPPRFYLPVEPEQPNSSYAQIFVNVSVFRDISDMLVDFDGWFREFFPQAAVLMRPFGVGPSRTWKFDVRIIGPGDADGTTLRELASEVENILEASPLAGFVRTDWRQRVQKIVPAYSQEKGRWAAITREDVANATKRAFDGRVIGLYRERDDLIPIVMRHVEEERRNVGGLDVIQVRPATSIKAVPLSQVINGVTSQWEDPLIGRRDRRRTIRVQSNPIPGVTLPTLRASLVEQVEAIEFPPGYKLEWGGEYESSRDSQASLIPGVVPALGIMILIIVMLFNAYRPPLVIILTIPFALIGITSGLLAFNSPFGFLALLGAMSLTGMMIKNAIVLLDEINIKLADGKSRYDSILQAAMSRLRPVILAAATTVLGVAPLLQDVFWVGLAITVMAGLTFGTVLTMVLVPVLYATLYGVKVEGA